jgi:hypothetical protein
LNEISEDGRQGRNMLERLNNTRFYNPQTCPFLVALFDKTEAHGKNVLQNVLLVLVSSSHF